GQYDRRRVAFCRRTGCAAGREAPPAREARCTGPVPRRRPPRHLRRLARRAGLATRPGARVPRDPKGRPGALFALRGAPRRSGRARGARPRRPRQARRAGDLLRAAPLRDGVPRAVSDRCRAVRSHLGGARSRLRHGRGGAAPRPPAGRPRARRRRRPLRIPARRGAPHLGGLPAPGPRTPRPAARLPSARGGGPALGARLGGQRDGRFDPDRAARSARGRARGRRPSPGARAAGRPGHPLVAHLDAGARRARCRGRRAPRARDAPGVARAPRSGRGPRSRYPRRAPARGAARRAAMSDPLVSILLPVRDAVATLPACLASIRRQTEERFECVVVDDGSRDRSRGCAEGMARGDRRLRVIALPPRGLVDALTSGLDACRGELVARMDADDLMHRHRLAEQSASLRADPTLSGVGCHVRVFPRAGLRPGLRDYERWLRGIDSAEAVRRERFVECPLPHPTWMLRREVLRRLGYRARGRPEDYDLLLRLLAAGLRLGVVPRRLLAWRDAPTRLWRSDPAYADERFLACKASFLAAGPIRHSDAYLLWGYGE